MHSAVADAIGLTLIGLTQLARCAFRRAVLPLFSFVVFALAARKNDKHMIIQYHAAACKTRRCDAEGLNCVSPNFNKTDCRNIYACERSGWDAPKADLDRSHG